MGVTYTFSLTLFPKSPVGLTSRVTTSMENTTRSLIWLEMNPAVALRKSQDQAAHHRSGQEPRPPITAATKALMVMAPSWGYRV